MKRMGLIETIIAVVGGLAGLSGLIGMLLMHRANRRKTLAEASHSEASAANEVADASGKITTIASDWMEKFSMRLEEVEKKIVDLRCENEKLKLFIKALMRGIRILLEQLEKNQIPPAWRPDERSLEDDDLR